MGDFNKSKANAHKHDLACNHEEKRVHGHEVSRHLLKIETEYVSKWVRQVREDGGEAFPGKGRLHPHDEELKKLQKELHRTRMERDILKKAIAYFAERPK